MNIIDRSDAVNVLQDINDTIQKVGIRPNIFIFQQNH
ncbi:hypothetical protein UACE39S_06145 [Ureibacillus acetophenoni]